MTLLGYDSETYLTQPGLPAPRLVVGSWSSAEEGEWLTNPNDTIAVFKRQLQAGTHLTAVNLPFDVVVAAAYDGSTLPVIWEAGNAGLLHDSHVREALNAIRVNKLYIDHKTGKSFATRNEEGDELGFYSMERLMSIHFDQDISEEKEGDVWRYKYCQLDGVPLEEYPSEASEYPKQDARRHRLIHESQDAKKYHNLHDEAAQVRAAIAIQFLVAWGVRTDADYIAWLKREAQQLWEDLRRDMLKVGLMREDGSKDTAALQARVAAAYKNAVPMTSPSKRFPKGQICTDRETLVESGDPDLVKLGSAGKNDKRITTYIPWLERGTVVPINPRYCVLKNTGRVSSDSQQLPQKGGVREAIKPPRKGHVLISLDYAGGELRTMSERALREPTVEQSKMAEYINAGKDTHSYVGAFFLGKTYEEFVPEAKGKLKPYRDLAKVFNFGAGGGSGPKTIAYLAKAKDGIELCVSTGRAQKCGIRRQEEWVRGSKKRVCSACIQVATELKAKWLRAWPEQALLFARASKLTAGNKLVDSTCFCCGRVRGECSYTQWLNNPFQAALGCAMKRAQWRIWGEQYVEALGSPLFGTRMTLQIHDELWIEAAYDGREKQAHDAAFRAAVIMVEEADRGTPHAKHEVEPAMMRRAFKAATLVKDRNGLIKPSWPRDWVWEADRAVMEADNAR